MNPLWLSYVPYTIAQQILEAAGASPIGHVKRGDAVALFADVSGFTALSEALGQAGRAGTEELTQILNAYFETMIDVIRSYGGIVAQFGGDALTALFPYISHTRQATTRRAIQCGLDMQANMDRYQAIETSAGTFTLTMKAGVGGGTYLLTTVGTPAVGLKTVIAGRALDYCAEAEHKADQGEVVVHNYLLPFAGRLRSSSERGKFTLVGRLMHRALENPLPPLERDLTDAERATFSAFLHPIIARRHTRGQSGFINEHRKVTVLFVKFGGFDYDRDRQVGAKLQTYFSSVMAIIQRYDGYLNKIDMGDKGSKYMVLFGAPVAHEDDEERALRCALELRHLSSVPATIGVNTGFAYCGLVGSEVRQEYTVMGDAVNLAARMMQAADDGQILASDNTYRQAATSFDWDSLESVTVKGKTDPVPVYALRNVRGRSIVTTQEMDYTLPMVGRAAEMQQVSDRLDLVMRHQGQIIGITAEAGMGKSRLAAEIVRRATERGLFRAGGECESYGTSTSYLVWHHIWRTLFGFDPALPTATQLLRLEERLSAIDPALGRRLPLLGPVLNLTIEDNELTAGLDAKLRKSSLESLLVAYLRHRAQETPLLLVLEDCHWLDPLSYDLLEVIGRNIDDVRIMILMVYRPPEQAHIDLGRVRRFAHFTELELAEFDHDEAETLIQLKLGRLFGRLGEPPRELVRLVTGKAQGNPFYIDEMINLLHDQNIDPQDVKTLQNLELPDSLHSLIISRIDRLVEDAKITLKVASVVGRLFWAGWLWHIYPRLGRADRVKDQLDALRQHDFVLPSGSAEPEIEYLFKHVVTQEVAYESLAVATRDQLHEQLGLFIERTYARVLDRYLDLLAYHYGHSQNVAKQREYFRRAGEAAQAAYANDAAVNYYQRLLPLLPENERTDVLLRLGQVWELTGKWTEAENIYREALTLADKLDHDRGRGQAHNDLGRLLTSQGEFEGALAELGQAQAGFEALDDQPGMCRAITNTGNVYLYQGDF
ncbi:MAG: AAA family ATPase, partial [Chloroflexi bacterium]|nr:AAA family ATPase [Chloroflexota bacterium]